MAEPEYRDIYRNVVSLDKLCCEEPAWAANVIRTLRKDRDAATVRAEAAEWNLDEARALAEQVASAHRVLSEKLDASDAAVDEARAIARRLHAHSHRWEPVWPHEFAQRKADADTIFSWPKRRLSA